MVELCGTIGGMRPRKIKKLPLPDNKYSPLGTNGGTIHLYPFVMHYPKENTHTTLQLSERELELLRWLAQGYSSKQIADHMCITKNTVDTHRRNLIQKTGCYNILHLVARCAKEGLI
jgi:DNA-binding CsgD family transcriptional regulator